MRRRAPDLVDHFRSDDAVDARNIRGNVPVASSRGVLDDEPTFLRRHLEGTPHAVVVLARNPLDVGTV